jgi:hypothetical protein
MIGLVNGAVVEFYGFSDVSEIEKQNHIVSGPQYMLVKIIHDTGRQIQLPGLPPSVVPLQKVKFTHGRLQQTHVTFEQFPVTLAYAITDYKCQGQTYRWVIIDIRKPTGRGKTTSASPYVQLSRATALYRLSIMRPFTDDELRDSLPLDLQNELQWQEDMALKTANLHGW